MAASPARQDLQRSQVYVDSLKVGKVLEELAVSNNAYRRLLEYIGADGKSELQLSESDAGRLLAAYQHQGYVLGQASDVLECAIARLDQLIASAPSLPEESPKKKQRGQSRIPVTFFGPDRPPDTYVIPEGHLAAARVCKDRKDPVWMLATVLRFFPDTSKYYVEDAECDEQVTAKQGYMVLRDNVLAVPMGEPDTLTKAWEFARDAVVFAMYPGTSCFYRAVVVEPPRRRKAAEYVVRFEDDHDESGDTPPRNVNPRFVLPVPPHA